MALEDSNEFAHLMQRYEKKLLSYIHRLTNMPGEDAEDLLQDIFIKTYQNLNGFDQDLKFSSWIYRITHNEVISHFRCHKNKGEKLSPEDSKIILEKLGSDFDIKKEVFLKIQAEKVKEIIDQLDGKYRDVLILKFLEEKDYEEISDILKKPMGTIATLINRAKKKLKDLLIKNNITN